MLTACVSSFLNIKQQNKIVLDSAAHRQELAFKSHSDKAEVLVLFSSFILFLLINHFEAKYFFLEKILSPILLDFFMIRKFLQKQVFLL